MNEDIYRAVFPNIKGKDIPLAVPTAEIPEVLTPFPIGGRSEVRTMEKVREDLVEKGGAVLPSNVRPQISSSEP